MSRTSEGRLKTLGLFERRIAGDDALLELARRRFEQACMGAEIHAATVDQMNWLLGLRPGQNAPVVVHLPRNYNLLLENTRKEILTLATAGADKVIGLVLHDQREMVERRADYLAAAHHLNAELMQIRNSPLLFIEYAVGLEPVDFLDFFSCANDLGRIAPCIDIGHVGIREAKAAYARKQHGHDICALKVQNRELPSLMQQVDTAVADGLAAVLKLVAAITALNKPVHFHLHDGHPLSTFSPFGVADHLSFFSEIPLNFEYQGRRAAPPMFGPAGLEKVITQALSHRDADRLSFTLEIHPTDELLPLGDAAPIFAHWTNKSNAERMNHWLSVLARNHSLLLQSIDTARQHPVANFQSSNTRASQPGLKHP